MLSARGQITDGQTRSRATGTPDNGSTVLGQESGFAGWFSGHWAKLNFQGFTFLSPLHRHLEHIYKIEREINSRSCLWRPSFLSQLCFLHSRNDQVHLGYFRECPLEKTTEHVSLHKTPLPVAPSASVSAVAEHEWARRTEQLLLRTWYSQHMWVREFY